MIAPRDRFWLAGTVALVLLVVSPVARSQPVAAQPGASKEILSPNPFPPPLAPTAPKANSAPKPTQQKPAQTGQAGSSGQRTSPPALPTTPIPTNAPQPAELSPADKPQPVLHARNANLGPCLSAVGRGAAAIDSPHSAYSLFNTTDPKSHAFVSIALPKDTMCDGQPNVPRSERLPLWGCRVERGVCRNLRKFRALLEVNGFEATAQSGRPYDRPAVSFRELKLTKPSFPGSRM